MPADSDHTSAANPGVFIPSAWIGCGKTYPEDDTPTLILDARKTVLAIPKHHNSLLPDPKVSVLGLLAADLPPRINYERGCDLVCRHAGLSTSLHIYASLCSAS